MKPTIKDIARMANVSTATVSRVLNNHPDGVGLALRNRILGLIRETGYRPNLLAKSMVTHKTYTVGLLSPDIAAPFYQHMMHGICDCLQASGYAVILCNTDSSQSDCRKYIEMLLSKAIDGILLTGFFGEVAHALTDLLTETPAVLFDFAPKLSHLAQINTDNRKSAYKLTKYLLALGHRRIGCITGPMQFDTVNERLKGYQKALKEAGIAFDPSIVLSGDFSTESALGPAELLLTKTNASAVFCFNDLMAYGVYKVCARLGRRIPQDISVVGFDDIPYSELLTPALTTVRQPSYRLGVEGAKMLLAQMSGAAGKPAKKILSNEMILRDSAQPFNAP
jgi:LacI family transcriptional regulator